MGDVHHSAVRSQLRILFEAGTVTGLSDQSLLERFVARRDEAAFTALLERHGPMVQRVCHEVLGDYHDAQDAFQATFLVLARQAGWIRQRESLASWLFGVALRVAASIRSASARRRTHERNWAALRPQETDGFRENRENLKALMHAEIGRLSERFRTPVILCYLEGRTYEEAAQVLCCPIGTIKSRLATARERLRRRLKHLETATSTGSVAMVLRGDAASEAITLPPRPSEVTIQAVVKNAIDGTAPVSISQLTEGMLKIMVWSRCMFRLGVAASVLLISTAVAGGAIGVAWMSEFRAARGGAEIAIPAPSVDNFPRTTFEVPPSRPPTSVQDGEPITLSGRVVDERGGPVPGAEVRIRLFRSSLQILRIASEVVDVREARTDADGRYRIDGVRGIEGGEYQHLAMDVNAPDFVQFFEFQYAEFSRVAKAKGELAILRLERGATVTGRCVGPDGKAVPGAKIRAAWAGKPMSSLGRVRTTDANGHFRLAIPHGLAAELVVYPEQSAGRPNRMTADGWVPRRVDVAVGGGDLGDIPLEAGVELTGQLVMPMALVSQEQVKDFAMNRRIPGGWALAGKVIALESTDRGRFGWFPINVACKTDQDGKFRLPVLKGSYKVWVAQAHDSGPDDRGPIVSDGPAPVVMPRVVEIGKGLVNAKDRSPRLESPKESLALTILPSVRIRGTITGPDGKPARGVSMLLEATIGDPRENHLTPLRWMATDAQGHYSFTGIPRGMTQAHMMVHAEPPDNHSYVKIVASGNFQGRVQIQNVAFDRLDRDQDPLDFCLKVEALDLPVAAKVPTAEDKELIKLGEERERLEAEFAAWVKDKPVAEQVALIEQKLPLNRLAGRFLDLARAHPDHPVAISALAGIFQGAAGVGSPDWPISRAREQAIDLAIEHHLGNPDIVLFFPSLQYGAPSAKGETLLRAALARSPHREVRTAACYELGRFLRFVADAPETLKTLEEIPAAADPESRLAREMGMRMLRRFAGVDTAKARAEAEQLFERVTREFADVPQALYLADGPGRLQFSRDLSHVENTKKYGVLAEQALFELRDLAVGKTAPEIEGEDVDGRRFRLSDYRGKVVALTFSGNWCGPCRAMYPKERALLKRLADKPFALVSVNTDEDPETLRKSIQDGEITWRCWHDGGLDGPICKKWNIASFLTIYLLDGQGVIRFKQVRGPSLDEAVDALLKQVKPPKR